MAQKIEAGLVAAGGIGAVAAEGAWNAWPDHIYLSVAKAASPLAFLEHSHIGLASIIADRVLNLHGAGLGIGGALIAIEATHTNPFGIGKPTEQTSTLAHMLLLGLAAIVYL